MLRAIIELGFAISLFYCGSTVTTLFVSKRAVDVYFMVYFRFTAPGILALYFMVLFASPPKQVSYQLFISNLHRFNSTEKTLSIQISTADSKFNQWAAVVHHIVAILSLTLGLDSLSTHTPYIKLLTIYGIFLR